MHIVLVYYCVETASNVLGSLCARRIPCCHYIVNIVRVIDVIDVTFYVGVCVGVGSYSLLLYGYSVDVGALGFG